MYERAYAVIEFPDHFKGLEPPTLGSTSVFEPPGRIVFEAKEIVDFPHDGGYTAKQEIFVVMKNTDRGASAASQANFFSHDVSFVALPSL